LAANTFDAIRSANIMAAIEVISWFTGMRRLTLPETLRRLAERTPCFAQHIGPFASVTPAAELAIKPAIARLEIGFLG
jgi:hypothetical protein